MPQDNKMQELAKLTAKWKKAYDEIAITKETVKMTSNVINMTVKLQMDSGTILTLPLEDMFDEKLSRRELFYGMAETKIQNLQSEKEKLEKEINALIKKGYGLNAN